MGVDWWDAVGCTQSAAEDGIGNVVKITCIISIIDLGKDYLVAGYMGHEHN